MQPEKNMQSIRCSVTAMETLDANIYNFVIFVMLVMRKFQWTKVPGNESASATHGTFTPGSESTWERKLQLPCVRVRAGVSIRVSVRDRAEFSDFYARQQELL